MMSTTTKHRRVRKARVFLSDTDIERLLTAAGGASVAALARRTGLPYMLLYNIVHRRVRSVSHRHYVILFGGPVPAQAPLKQSGETFRAMVDLWLYLNDGLTRSDLYRKLHGTSRRHRVDHRIFSGRIKTVDGRLVHAMRRQFSQAGIDGPLLDQWLDEFDAISPADRVPYTRIRPALDYLEQTLGLHPTTVLGQSVSRYESGQLKSVSRQVAEHAEALQRSVAAAMRTHNRADADRIRESILGAKPGYTRYAAVREELAFVIRTGGRGAKHFLGRSLWTYEQGKASHIADSRVAAIMQACDEIIRQRPDMAISALPRSRQRRHTRALLDILKARTTQLLSRKEGIDLERRILKPSRRRDDYSNPSHGFTPFDMAPRVLGMRRRAFDLMVTENCEIFRFVGKYSRRWYLSDLYLSELSGKENFKLILEKYERIARSRRRGPSTDACLQ